MWQTHFDTTAATEDINVVYPIDRLKELAEDGTIGRVARHGVSFMGYFSNVYRMRDEVVPAVVAAVRDGSGADAVVLVPVDRAATSQVDWSAAALKRPASRRSRSPRTADQRVGEATTRPVHTPRARQESGRAWRRGHAT